MVRTALVIEVHRLHRNLGDLDLVLAHRVSAQVARRIAGLEHVVSPVHAVEIIQRNPRQSNLDFQVAPLANQTGMVVCAETQCCTAVSAAMTWSMVACFVKVETGDNRGSVELCHNEILEVKSANNY